VLPDPAPGLLVNDIRGFFTQLRNGPVHGTPRRSSAAAWHGCLINGRDTREAFCPWLRAFGSDSR
jgi:hypothetical protein